MNLKERVIAILNKRDYTYEDLLKFLGVEKSVLDEAFEKNTLEVRTLELISKELRIPLYSFFRDPSRLPEFKEPYYTENIWEDSEKSFDLEINSLKKEIERLKILCADKDLLIKALEEELKQKS
jgi:transcriptional regulator with XRE-family HTH domain